MVRRIDLKLKSVTVKATGDGTDGGMHRGHASETRAAAIV